MAAPFYLLYRTGFAPTNGTSVQLSRVLAGKEQEMVHLMWDIEEAGATSVPYSVVVDDSTAWQWPFSRGKGIYSKLRKSLQLGWWGGEQLGQRKLKRHLSKISIKPDHAYIICLREWDARRAFALWDGLGRPKFLLHVMDIFHDELSESETPRFVDLVRKAEHVVCISNLIEAEVRRSGAKRTSVLPCGTDFTAENRRPLEHQLRMIITGAIWLDQYSNNPALDILVTAWPEIGKHFPGAELHYAGGAGSRLPAEVRSLLVDHGHLSTGAYQDLLRSSHLAYLPVSHPSNTFGRYSVPSRLVDYLACGLPTITCTDEETSIAAFMRTVPANCTANVADAHDFVEAVMRFASDPVSWAHVSTEAATFAEKRLRTEIIRSELNHMLSEVHRRAS